MCKIDKGLCFGKRIFLKGNEVTVKVKNTEYKGIITKIVDATLTVGSNDLEIKDIDSIQLMTADNYIGYGLCAYSIFDVLYKDSTVFFIGSAINITYKTFLGIKTTKGYITKVKAPNRIYIVTKGHHLGRGIKLTNIKQLWGDEDEL